ncbi:MAG: hypothetical protein EXX96DRAFT_557268 [Benjaminiella poitrasii]|nr:MAG: hypothetical protein EXX96DRAFT_557268 [Benjaminiella poitrasii]
MDAPNNTVSAFIADPYVRSSWIAFFTLWALWGLSYFLRHAFGRDNKAVTIHKTTASDVDPETGGIPATTTDPAVGTTAGAPNNKKKWYSAGGNANTTGVHNTLADRLSRSHEVLLENTLLLLSVLALNTLGAGSTRAVMILAWIFFALTAIYALTEVGYNHHYLRLLFNLIFYAITLAIGGLAFHYGWHAVGSVF